MMSFISRHAVYDSDKNSVIIIIRDVIVIVTVHDVLYITCPAVCDSDKNIIVIVIVHDITIVIVTVHDVLYITCPAVCDSDKNIQSGQHDSAEDARMALLLYKRYCDLQQQGSEVLKASISELYETGRRMGWKVPEVTVSQSQPWGPGDLGDQTMWTATHDSEEDILDPGQGF